MISDADRRSVPVLTLVLLGLTAGYAYSLILLAATPRFTYFLPLISFVRSLYFSLLLGGIAAVSVLLYRLDRRWWILPAGPVLLLAHFAGWASVSWAAPASRGGLSWMTSGGLLALLLCGIGLLAVGAFRRTVPTATACSLVFAGLVLLHLGSVKGLSTERIDDFLKYSTEEPSFRENRSAATLLLDPFSMSLEDALEPYAPLLPEVPEGRKIMVLVLDAFREDFFGHKLGKVQLTKNLEELAEDNLYFSNYRTQANWTKPSTASLFTGEYIRDHGTYIGGGGNLKKTAKNRSSDGREEVGEENYWGHALPEHEVTLAERLRREGFRTFGLTEINHISARYQFDQGFGTYLGHPDGFRKHPDYLLRRVLYWLLRERPGDAFLYVHLKGPHYPYPLGGQNERFWNRTRYRHGDVTQLPEWNLPSTKTKDLVQTVLPPTVPEDISAETRFLKHLYGSELYSYDRLVVPRYENLLRQLELWDETTYLVTSDHGEGIYDHDRYFGHGLNLHEEVVHVPLVVKPDDQLSVPRSNRNQPLATNLESIDLTTTLLELAGVGTDGLPGRSFLPRMTSEDSPDTVAFAFSEKTGVDNIRTVALTKPPWKLIHDLSTGENQLFNLRRDPEESRPVEDRPALTSRLESRVREQWGDGSIAQEAPLKNMGEKERKDLRGLGYLE